MATGRRDSLQAEERLPTPKENSSEKTPKRNPSENAEKFQQIIRELQKSGLVVHDTTEQGGGIGIVGGVRKPKQSRQC